MDNILFYETITQPKSLLNLLPIIILTVAVTGLLIGTIFGIAYSVKNTSITISDNKVIFKSFLYGRKIPIEDILIDEIQSINLNQNREYSISIRTNGIALPNFYSGWMRLKNGKKALVYITNKENVLLMPTKDFIVLFSMEKTEEFKKILNSQYR